MTQEQLDALQAYMSAVVRLMTRNETFGHAHNVRYMLDAKARLEKAFGLTLEGKPNFPDIL